MMQLKTVQAEMNSTNRRPFNILRCLGPSTFLLLGFAIGWAFCNVAWLIFLYINHATAALNKPMITLMTTPTIMPVIAILSLVFIRQARERPPYITNRDGK